MKPPPFGYARPDTVEEAVTLLGELGPEAKVLAGGQSLMPLLNFRLSEPTHLVDVNRLATLGVVDSAGELSIGALVRHRTLERAPALREAPWRAFSEGVGKIGHLPVRVRGTVGGSLAHADPSAELPLLVTTYDGTLAARSAAASRDIPVEEFFQGFLSTALEPTELLTGVRVPAPPAGAVSAFEEFAERSGDFAIIAVCGIATLDGEGTCTWARLGVAGAEPRPRRAFAAEDHLVGRPLSDEVIGETAAALEGSFAPMADARADAAFRRELMALLATRVLRRLRERLPAAEDLG